QLGIVLRCTLAHFSSLDFIHRWKTVSLEKNGRGDHFSVTGSVGNGANQAESPRQTHSNCKIKPDFQHVENESSFIMDPLRLSR
ncbi:MAG: hypothetical protein ACQERR_05685, partial [Pseudomonadota bacterium]